MTYGYVKARKAAGLCVPCGKNPARSGFTSCKECSVKAQRKADQKFETLLSQGLCPKHPKEPVRPGKKRCEICRVKSRERDRIAEKARLRRIRVEIIEAYGSKCNCCGLEDSRFLCLDHVNNDGNHERKVLGLRGYMFYLHIKRAGFPRDRYQILCYNCNMVKAQNDGVCPHEVDRWEAEIEAEAMDEWKINSALESQWDAEREDKAA